MRRQLAQWRYSIAVILLTAGVWASAASIRWVWRDITHWSRSATFDFQSDDLKACIRRAVIDWPGARVSLSGPVMVLQLPPDDAPADQTVLVKETAEPHVGRVVIDGHSTSISYLGPTSETDVRRTLERITHRLSNQCSGS